MRLCTVSSTPATDGGAGLVLPCAYSDISGGNALTGEQRLMLAMLVDAINVYQKGAMSHDARARRLYVDADHWIMANALSGDVLSFENVCDALGINAALLRRRIIGWKHALNHERRDRIGSRLSLRITPRERPTNHRRGRPPEQISTMATASATV
jgi:hypothetical protein